MNTLEEAAAGRKARGRLKGLKHPLCVCVRERQKDRKVNTNIPQMYVCFSVCARACVCVSVGREAIPGCVCGSRASICISSKCRTSQHQRGSLHA